MVVVKSQRRYKKFGRLIDSGEGRSFPAFVPITLDPNFRE